ncbi:DUF3263 domain-containing protein [Nocardioides aequoreus]|uniref:DUF3263 domain-containing protein n=1 Tax=Nocardioides aequoreus TaxID=397278 RepID=UPI000567A4D0|nr:DUF3263 domain-containing protein [Nocardioides aequoreus]
MPDHQDLTEQQRTILDFEAQRPMWKHVGAKEATIREELGLSAPRYHQILNALLDHPAAAAYAPQTVSRLRRLRARRKAQRAPSRDES